MSIVLFFGIAGGTVLFGLFFTGLVIRHHWRLSKAAKKQKS